MNTNRKLMLGVAALALLSPVGILLPEWFKAGAAWGEWSPDELKNQLGFVPEGIGKLAEVWKALIPDYVFRSWEGKGLAPQSAAYLFSALLGVAACAGFAWVLSIILANRKR